MPQTSYPGSIQSGGSSTSQFASSAFASLPAAASSTGLIYSVSDIGNSLWRSNGTSWKPLGGVAIVGSSAAQVLAPANDTNENALATVTIPANSLGTDGALEITTVWSCTNSSNNKTVRVRFSGVSGTQFLAGVQTTITGVQYFTLIQNRGAANSQMGMQNTALGFASTSGTVPTTASVDTTSATTLVFTGQKATGSEVLALERYMVKIVIP